MKDFSQIKDEQAATEALLERFSTFLVERHLEDMAGNVADREEHDRAVADLHWCIRRCQTKIGVLAWVLVG